MAALTTKADIYDKTAKTQVRIWKSIAVASGDTLATGLKQVFSVSAPKLTNWSASGGTVTLTLSGAITGAVVVTGR